MEKIEVRTIKEQFVPAEYSLLVKWAPFLEEKVKGSVLTYLQMQVGVIRNPESEDYGKTIFKVETLSKRCGVSRASLYRIFRILEEFGFVNNISNGGSESKFEILEVPSFKDYEIDKINLKPTTKVEDIDESAIFDVPPPSRISGEELYMSKVDNSISEVEALPEVAFKSAYNFMNYFKSLYFRENKIKYVVRDPRVENSIINSWRKNYDYKQILKIIKYAVCNWKDFNFVEGLPNIRALSGFMQRIAPDALLDKQVGLKAGEYANKKDWGQW